MYSQRVLSLGRFFNSTIENVLYDWPIRNRIGPFNAGDVYTIPAWSINVVYSRLRPRGFIKTTLFRLLLASLRYSLAPFIGFAADGCHLLRSQLHHEFCSMPEAIGFESRTIIAVGKWKILLSHTHASS